MRGGRVSKSMNLITLGEKRWKAAYLEHSHQWRGYSFSSSGMAVGKGCPRLSQSTCAALGFISIPSCKCSPPGLLTWVGTISECLSWQLSCCLCLAPEHCLAHLCLACTTVGWPQDLLLSPSCPNTTVQWETARAEADAELRCICHPNFSFALQTLAELLSEGLSQRISWAWRVQCVTLCLQAGFCS